jgi:hypothetical protein
VERQVIELARSRDAALTPFDIEELERRFRQEIADDLNHLKDELRAERIQAFFSKDVVTTFVGIALPVVSTMYPPAAALQGVLTAAGVPVTLGGVIGVRSKWLKARADVLRKHPMAFIYELQNS